MLTEALTTYIDNIKDEVGVWYKITSNTRELDVELKTKRNINVSTKLKLIDGLMDALVKDGLVVPSKEEPIEIKPSKSSDIIKEYTEYTEPNWNKEAKCDVIRAKIKLNGMPSTPADYYRGNNKYAYPKDIDSPWDTEWSDSTELTDVQRPILGGLNGNSKWQDK